MEPVNCNDANNSEQFLECYCDEPSKKEDGVNGAPPKCVAPISANSGPPPGTTTMRTDYLTAIVSVPLGLAAVITFGILFYDFYYKPRMNRIAPAPAPAPRPLNPLTARTYASDNTLRNLARIETFMPAANRLPMYAAINGALGRGRISNLTIRTADF